ncbi:MAG: hypothetical protein K8I03_16425 [Ignavibacteria bacterium]|nr:hypothetical protein [Ignavibacteria bacterium]
MKKFIALLITGIAVSIIGCGENSNPVDNTNTGDIYEKIATVENGNIKFEVWAVDDDTLMTGYNKIGFKVFENGNPKTGGFVKFFAKMFHFNSTSFHATPVEPLYNYNSSLGMFTGYLIMLMPSDSTSRWYAYYNYNDELSIDSVRFDVGWDQKTKFKIFTDLTAQLSYLITMTAPEEPIKGMNDFYCLLHESPDFNYFTQVNTASMNLTVKLDSLNHTSGGNVNPVYIGDGLYKGKVNFDNSGRWSVYDSIYYNNRCITSNGTPYIYFFVP